MISGQITSTDGGILIVGCGDIGMRTALLWQEHNTPVYAISHSPARAAEFRQADIRPLFGDLDALNSTLPLPAEPVRYIYYFAPPAAGGNDDPRMEHFLDRLSQQTSKPEKIIYISTSGVYGDHQGGWVDETTTPNPQTERSKRRLAAEQALQAWCADNGVTAVILRVGGIYGPGRLPLARLKAGMGVLKAELAPATNRIHADDLAAACYHTALNGIGIYNIADGQNSTMSDYFITLARVAGLPEPEQLDWPEARERFSPEMLSYLTESRRLNIERLMALPGFKLRYPDLESGLKQALDQIKTSAD